MRIDMTSEDKVQSVRVEMIVAVWMEAPLYGYGTGRAVVVELVTGNTVRREWPFVGDDLDADARDFVEANRLYKMIAEQL